MTSALKLPAPLRTLFSHFPLHTYPPTDSPYRAKGFTKDQDGPVLWVLPPRSLPGKGASGEDEDLLSSDVECLKWQAYLALRGVQNIRVRWDISPDGAVGGRLPNLHVPLDETEQQRVGVHGDVDNLGEILPANLIRDWADKRVGDVGELEGYVDEAARDESRAWFSLFEDVIYSALVGFTPQHISILDLLTPYTTLTALTSRPLETTLTPPPAPLTGLLSVIPPYGVHVDLTALEERYKDAIQAVGERLGGDKWFLGSEAPTALDALFFAYLHVLAHSSEHTLRYEVVRRANLAAWEMRVQKEVKAAFRRYV